MNRAITAAYCGADPDGSEDIEGAKRHGLALDELNVLEQPEQVFPPAGGEVAEDSDAMPITDRASNEIRADEATAAGDENPLRAPHGSGTLALARQPAKPSRP